MKKLAYTEGDVIILIKKDKARELKKVLQDLTELHERLTKIVVRDWDWEAYINEHGGKLE